MIRFGIAGFGLHGDKRVMPGFAKASRCRVTAISRRDAMKAKATAERYGIAHAFTSTDALATCPDVDAVFVTSPNALHLQDTIACLKRGKPVLVEKPMGMNAEECRQMIAAAREAKLKIGVAQVFRFEESTRRMREHVASGALGPLVMARAAFTFPGRGHVRSWISDAAIAGGGPIADIGVHCIDSLRFIVGDEVEAVSAFTRSDEESRNVEASAALNLRFRSGLLASVVVSFRAGYRSPIEIAGEAATISAVDALNVERPITLELKRNDGSVTTEEVTNHMAYARQVEAFSDWLTDNIVFPAPGEEGLRNQLVLDAAYRSARTGKVETIPAESA
jgi:predicted dehydrogenase